MKSYLVIEGLSRVGPLDFFAPSHLLEGASLKVRCENNFRCGGGEARSSLLAPAFVVITGSCAVGTILRPESSGMKLDCNAGSGRVGLSDERWMDD